LTVWKLWGDRIRVMYLFLEIGLGYGKGVQGIHLEKESISVVCLNLFAIKNEMTLNGKRFAYQ
jgi:hypothetical protein